MCHFADVGEALVAQANVGEGLGTAGGAVALADVGEAAAALPGVGAGEDAGATVAVGLARGGDGEAPDAQAPSNEMTAMPTTSRLAQLLPRIAD
jgi:hypothetical protein